MNSTPSFPLRQFRTIVVLLVIFSSSAQAQWIPIVDDLKVLGNDIKNKVTGLPGDIETLGDDVGGLLGEDLRREWREVYDLVDRLRLPGVNVYLLALEMDASSSRTKLPEKLKQILRPHFKEIELDRVRVCNSIDTWHGQHITVGHNIYWSSRDIDLSLAYKNKASAAKRYDDLWILLHELEHVVQYQKQGGITPFLLKYLVNGAGEIASNGSFQIHDELQLEKEADAKANRIYEQVAKEWYGLKPKNIPIHDTLQIGDFNGDGKSDILANVDADHDGKRELAVLYSGMDPWRVLSESSVDVRNVRVGDFNGDKRTDVIANTNLDSDKAAEIGVLYSGSGAWKLLSQSTVSTKNVRVGFFSQEKASDIIANTFFNLKTGRSRIGVMKGGTQRWSELSGSSVKVNAIRLGDVNGDGITDIVANTNLDADKSMEVGVLLSGKGRWKLLSQSTVRVQKTRLGDFNGDGEADIIANTDVNGDGKQEIGVMYSGMGRWQPLSGSTVRIDNVAIGDFNADGKSDIIASVDGDADGKREICALMSGTGTWVVLSQSSLTIRHAVMP